MSRAYFSASVSDFLSTPADEVLGALTRASEFSVELPQRDAWRIEIDLLRSVLIAAGQDGTIHLEFVVPRLGKRIDAVLVFPTAVVVLEFKVGATEFLRQDIDQVWDYALDLKNFHETSHRAWVVPVLVATKAKRTLRWGERHWGGDDASAPTLVSADCLEEALREIGGHVVREKIQPSAWAQGRYRPTPTIVEAASALFRGHSVEEISRSDASARNLAETSAAIVRVVEKSKRQSIKSICLVTGVPGAGKTLVGLDIATRFRHATDECHGVYL